MVIIMFPIFCGGIHEAQVLTKLTEHMPKSRMINNPFKKEQTTKDEGYSVPKRKRPTTPTPKAAPTRPRVAVEAR